MKWIRISALIIVTAALAAPFLWPDTPAPSEEAEIHTERGPIPGPLGLTILDEAPELTFTCPTIAVPGSVQNARSEIAAAAAEANARASAIRSRLTLPYEVIRGREDTNAVALTVDTGTAGAYGTDELLRIAKHYDIELTFFVTGCWVLENPGLTRRIVAEGHSLGHHSLTHLNLAGQDREVVSRELDEPIRIIEETTGVRVALFRKPQYAGGASVTAAAGERGIVSVQGWPDFGDTLGWSSETTADDVLARVQRTTGPGAIWVFHNISLDDLRAFENIVRFHLENGYNLVRVEDLI